MVAAAGSRQGKRRNEFAAMSPQSEDGAPIGNHREQSQSVINMVAEQSATPV